MNIIPIIYIVSLYILCIPGIFLKHSKKYSILYALLFSILFYFSFEFINAQLETMDETSVPQNNDEMKDLVDSIHNHATKIEVDVSTRITNIPAKDNKAIIEECEKKIKEIVQFRQEIDNIKIKIEKFANNKELLVTLEKTKDQLDKKIVKLDNRLRNMRETIDVKEYTGKMMDIEMYRIKELFPLKNELIDKQIQDISGNLIEINALSNDQSDLQNKIDEEDRKIAEKEPIIQSKSNEITSIMDNLRKLNNEIEGQIETIRSDQADITQDESELNAKNNTIQGINSKLINLKNQNDAIETRIGQLINTINEKKEEKEKLKKEYDMCKKYPREIYVSTWYYPPWTPGAVYFEGMNFSVCIKSKGENGARNGEYTEKFLRRDPRTNRYNNLGLVKVYSIPYRYSWNQKQYRENRRSFTPTGGGIFARPRFVDLCSDSYPPGGPGQGNDWVLVNIENAWYGGLRFRQLSKSWSGQGWQFETLLTRPSGCPKLGCERMNLSTTLRLID